MSIPSRFLEEVPNQLVENLGGRSPAQSQSWSTASYGSRASGYGPARRPSQFSEFADQHYNYEDESQEATGPVANSNKGVGAGGRNGSTKPFVASWMAAKSKPASPNLEPGQTSSSQESIPKGEGAEAHSIDSIARFFGGKAGAIKPGALSRSASSRPPMDIPFPRSAANLAKGQRVRHSKYGEGTILMREGDGEDAKLTVLFSRHGMKKLMEKFANLQKI